MDTKLMSLAASIYEKTQSGIAVAKRLNVSHSTAYRLLKAAGVALPDRHGPEIQERKKKLHGEIAANAARDYDAGMSSADLCAKYSASMWAIRTAVKDYGVKMRGRGGRYRSFTEAECVEMVTLYQSGWAQAAIAAKFKSTQVMVSRLLRANGVETRIKGASGSQHGMWKGGKIKTAGYIGVLVAPDDPMRAFADNSGYVREHRLVMSRLLGRPLTRDETVHHINGDKTDNRPSNLQLRFGRHGKGVKMVCAACGCDRVSYVRLD